MSTEYRLTLLHLSDFHCHVDTETQSEMIFNSFIEDLKDWQKANFRNKINLILITGDIAKVGADKNNYDIAKKRINNLLLATDLTPKDLFIIPGNRDFNHTKGNDVESKRKEIIDDKNRNRINSLFNNKPDLKPFIDCFDNYRQFIKDINNNIIAWPEDGGKVVKPWYSHSINFGNFKIAIIGLTTSILSCYKLDDDEVIHCEPSDKGGRVRFGIDQLIDALNKADSDKCNYFFVLTHHALKDICEEERSAMENLMANYNIIHLHGHTHELDSFEVTRPTGVKYLSSGTGCLYKSFEEPCGYNIIEIDFTHETITQWPRRWGPFKGRWYPDWEWSNLTPDQSITTNCPWAKSEQGSNIIHVITDIRFYDSALFMWILKNNKDIFKRFGYQINFHLESWKTIPTAIQTSQSPAIGYYNRKFKYRIDDNKLKYWGDLCIYKGYSIIARDIHKFGLKENPDLQQAKEFLTSLKQRLYGKKIKVVHMGGDIDWRFDNNPLIEELNLNDKKTYDVVSYENPDDALKIFENDDSYQLYVGGLPQRLNAAKKQFIELLSFDNCPLLFSINSLLYNDKLEDRNALFLLSMISHEWFETIATLKRNNDERTKAIREIINMLSKGEFEQQGHNLRAKLFDKVIRSNNYIMFSNNPSDMNKDISMLTRNILESYNDKYSRIIPTKDEWINMVYDNITEAMKPN